MFSALRARFTYANVMATIAVFVVLGGSGYAATKIDGANIKNKSISGKKLKNRTISGRKIKKSTINALTGATGATGATGQNGDSASSMLTGKITGLPTTNPAATRFGSPSGASAADPAGDGAMLSPASRVVARDLSVQAPALSNASWTVVLQVGGADSALRCTAPAGSNPVCHDSSHAVAIPPGSQMRIEVTKSTGTVFNAAPLLFGFRATGQ